MGAVTEAQIATQLRKRQGETNDRLDALIREQQPTNQLLEWLGQVMAPHPPADS
jgi:hypothetical protein